MSRNELLERNEVYLFTNHDGGVWVTKQNDSFATCALIALAENRGLYGKEYDGFVSQPWQKQNKKDRDNGHGEKITVFINAPKSFQDMCRYAAKQRRIVGAEKDGCTKSLTVMLKRLKTHFNQLSSAEKSKLGLSGMSEDDLTHFHLMEIGLYGSVRNTSLPQEILVRNQNLIEIYSAKYMPVYYDDTKYFHVSGFYLPDLVADEAKTDKSHHKNLYEHPIQISRVRAQSADDILFDADYEFLTKKTAAAIFIEKISAAVTQYENEITGWANFWRRPSAESTALYTTLKDILNNTTLSIQEKINAIQDQLNQHRIKDGGHFSTILKEAGFLNRHNKSIFPRSMQSGQTTAARTPR